MIPVDWIELAEKRIRPHIVETPLTWDAKRGIYIKWENHQVTGSFKARGALNKVLSLTEAEKAAGLVAVSAGNHGQGAALAAALVGASLEVFVPQHTAPSKIETMRRLGAQVRVVEGGYAVAEAAGRAYAESAHKTFVSPYNDGQVIAGQGTLAAECLRQLARLNRSHGGGETQVACWIVPVGGAGLIAGCGTALATCSPRPKLIGVQAAASAFAHGLYYHHSQEGIQDNPTLAEGLSGEVEANSVTIPMMRRHVDRLILVEENEIRRAITMAWHAYGERIEGSAAVSLAAISTNQVPERPAILVVTGGNIEDQLHQAIVAEYAVETWN